MKVRFLFDCGWLLLNRHVGEVVALGDVCKASIDLIVLQNFVLGSRLTASLTAFIAAVLLRKRLLRSTRLALEASLRASTDDVGHLLLCGSDIVLASSLQEELGNLRVGHGDRFLVSCSCTRSSVIRYVI